MFKSKTPKNLEWWLQSTANYLIFGLECLKNCRNFGMRTLSGRLSASLSNNSAESSQIFWSAPNEPWNKSKKLQLHICREVYRNITTNRTGGNVPNSNTAVAALCSRMLSKCIGRRRAILPIHKEFIWSTTNNSWLLRAFFRGNFRNTLNYIISYSCYPVHRLFSPVYWH